MKILVLIFLFVVLVVSRLHAGIALPSTSTAYVWRQVRSIHWDVRRLGRFLNRERYNQKVLQHFQEQMIQKAEDTRDFPYIHKAIDTEIRPRMMVILAQAQRAEKQRMAMEEAASELEKQELLLARMRLRQEMWDEYQKLKDMIAKLERETQVGAVVEIRSIPQVKRGEKKGCCCESSW